MEKDFDKQFTQASERPDVSHFVMLALYGQPGEPERWLRRTLMPRLLATWPTMAVDWEIAPESIELNRPDCHTQMIVAAARVSVARADSTGRLIADMGQHP